MIHAGKRRTGSHNLGIFTNPVQCGLERGLEVGWLARLLGAACCMVQAATAVVLTIYATTNRAATRAAKAPAGALSRRDAAPVKEGAAAGVLWLGGVAGVLELCGGGAGVED